jgi:hypothetical protein
MNLNRIDKYEGSHLPGGGRVRVHSCSGRGAVIPTEIPIGGRKDSGHDSFDAC